MENTVSFTWHGFNGIRFEFEGREAILVFPHKADETVDYEENGAFLADACRDYDRFLLIKRENQGHHPHGLSDPAPIVDFIIDACR